MKDSSSHIEKNSMFSVNTMMSMHADNNIKNYLTLFYNNLMSEYSKEYPYLSKIYFLHLVLNQHLILYTPRRETVKDLWLSLSKCLKSNTPNIYIIDNQTDLEDIFKTNNHNNRFMFLDLHKVSNKGINYMLNKMGDNVSLLAVQTETDKLHPEVTGLFSLCFQDQEQDNFQGIIEAIRTKPPKNQFKSSQFQDCINLCWEKSQKNQEEQGFLKIYMTIMKQKIKLKGLNIAHSRWKNTIKVLNFIGTTRSQGKFKKFTLTECCLAPNLLASTLQELTILSQINQHTIIQILPYYGAFKFMKNIKDHFWLQKQTKAYYYSLAQKMGSSQSFFYPCFKFPETVSIQYNNKIFYRIQGHQKKLMSDKFIDVDPHQSYTLSLGIRNSCKMIIHIGLACYDSQKQPIQPVQVCRKSNSEVVINYIDDNKIYVKDTANLTNWINFSSQTTPFAYQRCIGVYGNGDIDQVLPIQSIIVHQKQAYSKLNEHGAYSKIASDHIQLSPYGKQWVFTRGHLMKGGKVVLMNHYEGGTYIISQSLNQYDEEWRQLNMKFKGESRENDGKSFFPTTKYVRVVIMANYNSGHPHYQIAQKDAFLDLKDIKWFLST